MIHAQTSVVTIVQNIIQDAVSHRASDIHAEPLEQGLRIRFRIDGVLHDHGIVPVAIMAQVISRIKIIANIDIAEKRIPQDGKFSLDMPATTIDFRVSTFPTMYGEKVVVRILDRSATIITLESLGVSRDLMGQIKQLLAMSSGFFLVSGPTGSGKTTTLYAALLSLNTPERNIITLEDPVEYQIPGITQGHIHPVAGFSFAKGLRALLRQDPDVVMIGEIRDQETAGIALEASLTGHVVLSTIHTVDAPSVIMRLMDMGIQPFLINAGLTGVLAQRLARRLCVACKAPRPLSHEEKLFLSKLNYTQDHVYDALGCQQCHGLGYAGRVGIFELLLMTQHIRGLLIQEPSLDDLQAQARSDGLIPMFMDGIDKVARGIISLKELIKVVA